MIFYKKETEKIELVARPEVPLLEPVAVHLVLEQQFCVVGRSACKGGFGACRGGGWLQATRGFEGHGGDKFIPSQHDVRSNGAIGLKSVKVNHGSLKKGNELKIRLCGSGYME